MKTLTLPPNQNANWCQGFPCRAPAGMWSMWRFSTYRRSCSLRAADAAILFIPSWKESAGVASRDAGGAGGIGADRPLIRSAAFSAMASTVAFGWALGMTGITDASATRSPVIPRTRSSVSTTAPASVSGADPAGAGRVVVAADRAADLVPQPGAGPAPAGQAIPRSRATRANAALAAAWRIMRQPGLQPVRVPLRRAGSRGRSAGPPAGPAEASRTEPRLSGATTAATRAKPPSGGRRPAGATGSRIGNRCRSGQAPASGLRSAA